VLHFDEDMTNRYREFFIGNVPDDQPAVDERPIDIPAARPVAERPTMGSVDRFTCAVRGIGVLRALEITNTTMTYKQFAVAVGVMKEDERWHVRHRHLVSDILNLIAAVQLEAAERYLPFNRIIVERTGESGEGIHRVTRLTREPPPPPSA
jgi:hypothetical protein